MRVVQDPADAQRRRGDAATSAAGGDSFEVVGGGGTGAGAVAGGTAAAANKPGLPLLPAGLFLLACAAGGALVAVIRPLGLG